MVQLLSQSINLYAAVLLLVAFAMITQRRVLSLIHLFTAQGATLVAASQLVSPGQRRQRDHHFGQQRTGCRGQRHGAVHWYVHKPFMDEPRTRKLVRF